MNEEGHYVPIKIKNGKILKFWVRDAKILINKNLSFDSENYLIGYNQGYEEGERRGRVEELTITLNRFDNPKLTLKKLKRQLYEQLKVLEGKHND